LGPKTLSLPVPCAGADSPRQSFAVTRNFETPIGQMRLSRRSFQQQLLALFTHSAHIAARQDSNAGFVQQQMAISERPQYKIVGAGS
ncbi:hypothetical protein NL526_27935, partial [Klebsiella pneumoniae]|nr:hypothetical protein [Klebsiella pneumoniae]